MNKAKTLLPVLFILLLASCKEQSPYFINDVTIDIREDMIGRTFACMEFTPSREAFFYVGILEIDSLTDIPNDNDTHFMNLMLDSTYIEYVKWRHDLLERKVPYIASFADHMLMYGKTSYFFVNLQFGKEYMVYAFAVDPQEQVPVGKMFTKRISTNISAEEYKKYEMHFDFSVDGYWDFVYPVDSSRQIISDIPYSALIVTKDEIVDYFNGDTVQGCPFLYYIYNFNTQNYFSGVFKYYDGVTTREHRNNSDSTIVNFVEGETYYVGMSSLDGYASNHGVTVYKFKWEGEETRFDMQFETDDIGFSW